MKVRDFLDFNPAPVSTVRIVTWSALFIALGVLFPILFHLFGLGPVFLPMFLPILTAGFVLPPVFAVLVGVVTPLVSFLLTQMPPFLILPLMMSEGFFLGGIPSVFFQKLKWNFWLVLGGTLIFDRMLLAVLVLFLSPVFHLPPRLASGYVVLQGLPGVVLNFIFVPVLVKILPTPKTGERKSY